MNQTSRVLPAGLLFAGMLGLGSAARGADDVQFSVRTGVGSSDNMTRSSIDPQDDTIAEIGAALSFSYRSRHLEVRADGDFAYQEYLNDTYDDDVIGSFNGTADISIVAERVDWVVEESFGQTRQDLSAGITPGNRENINVFETGPELNLPLGGRNSLELHARYRTIDYEVTPLDSDRLYGSAGIMHHLSEQSSLGLAYEYEQIEYTQVFPSANYNRQNAFVRYEMYNSRNDLVLDAGMAQISGDGGNDEGPLLRVSYTHRLTSRNQIWAELAHEFSDAGFKGEQYAGVPTSDRTDQALSQTSEPFTSDFGMFGWSVTGRRTELVLAAAHSKETYEQAVGSNRVRDEFTLDLTRRLGASWTALLAGRYDKNDFQSADPDYVEHSVSLAFSRRMSRQFYFDAAYIYTWRDGDLEATNFKENNVWLRVRYGDTSSPRFGSERSRSEWNK